MARQKSGVGVAGTAAPEKRPAPRRGLTNANLLSCKDEREPARRKMTLGPDKPEKKDDEQDPGQSGKGSTKEGKETGKDLNKELNNEKAKSKTLKRVKG